MKENYLLDADSKRGRFRSFLLGAVQHFLANEWDRANAVKRGGRQIPVSIDMAEAEVWHALPAMEQATPESLYERRWALSLLETVALRLRKEFEDAGKAGEFDKLSCFEQGFRPSRYDARTKWYICRALHVSFTGCGKYRSLLRAELPPCEWEIDERLDSIVDSQY
jgi:RNA polymerase sigma-70 factor (ECF subfamily)